MLCEDEPTEETIREERRLIYGLEAPRPVQADLLAVAAMLGTRFFSRELLATLFREEMEMLKEASFITDWLDERAAEAGASGRAEGEAKEARNFLLRQLRKRFKDLPVSVVERVEQADREWCEEIGERLL